MDKPSWTLEMISKSKFSSLTKSKLCLWSNSATFLKKGQQHVNSDSGRINHLMKISNILFVLLLKAFGWSRSNRKLKLLILNVFALLKIHVEFPEFRIPVCASLPFTQNKLRTTNKQQQNCIINNECCWLQMGKLSVENIIRWLKPRLKL